MSTISAPAQPASTQSQGGSPIWWGARVALLLIVFDALVGYKIPAYYYDRLQLKVGPFWTAEKADTAFIGHMILVAVSIVLTFLFAWLLARRPFWMRANSAALSPTVAAVFATTTTMVVWSLALAVLGLATGFIADTAFKYIGGILAVLLIHTVGFFYAGFAAASGDDAQARRIGGIAGLVTGILAAIGWAIVDVIFSFTGDLDPTFTYATFISVARLVLFALIGYYAGRQGAIFWRTDGTGRAPRVVAQARAARAPRAGFRFTAGMFWGLVGLLLIAIFFAPAKVYEIGAFVTGAAVNWAVAIAIAVAAFAIGIGIRAVWPSLLPLRRAIGRTFRAIFAIGGDGYRTRSKGARRILIALALLFVLFWPYLDQFVLGPGYDARISVLSDTGYYVILALGLNVVVGFAGLLDLGYVAFFAFGAYTWAAIGAPEFSKIGGLFNKLSHFPIVPQMLPFGLPWAWWFWPTLLIGAFVAAFFGVLLGAPTLRLRGDYLAIVTLGFGEIVPIVFKNIPGLTEGTNGINGVPSAVIPGLTFPISDATPYYYIILVLIALTVVGMVRLRDSRLGRAWVALREDEIAVAASGVNTVRTKLLAFATGAFFSGLAGVYHSARLGVITPGDFSFGDSIIYLAMVVLGGLGSIPGVMVGALVIALLNLYVLNQLNVLRNDPSSVFYILHSVEISSLRNIIFGGLLVVMMLLRPEGLIPNVRRRAELHNETLTGTEGPVLGSLDAAIGGPAYAEERVE